MMHGPICISVQSVCKLKTFNSETNKADFSAHRAKELRVGIMKLD